MFKKIIVLSLSIILTSCGGGSTAYITSTPSTPSALSLLAGNPYGFGSVDAVGASASFNGPTGITADTAGNLYVADSNNNTIRKIDISTGAVTTLAGTAGVTGSADGTGANASFSSPNGITTDNAGNLYVTDTTNNTIRKIVISTGVVTTLAGTAGVTGNADGIGANASFNTPTDVTADNAGNLYVVDSSNNTIRKIVISTGAVTTLAGTAGVTGSADATGTSASFNYPQDITTDNFGNLYVTDSNNNTIRKIVISTGVVTTLAGTAGVTGNADGIGANASFNYPYGITTDNAGNLYVADSTNNKIRQIQISTGSVTTLAGTAGVTGNADGIGANASFNYPYGITTDNAGNLYVADSTNNKIRQIQISTGSVTTLAGNAGVYGRTDGAGTSASFSNPRGVTTDNAGNLYVADSDYNIIRKIDISSGVVTTLAGAAGVTGSADGTGASASFSFPYGITTDNAGNLYVADSNNNTIRKIVISTGAVTTLAGTAGVTGHTDATGAAASFSFSYGITADNSGNLYVTDSNNNTIRKIVISTGAVTTLAGTAGVQGSTDATGANASFNYPLGITTDNSGNLYVTDYYNNTIRKIVISTGVVTTLAGTAGVTGNADGIGTSASFNGPEGVITDNTGNLYVGEYFGSVIRKIVISTGKVTTIAGHANQTGYISGNLPGYLPRVRFMTLIGSSLYFAASNAILEIANVP